MLKNILEIKKGDIISIIGSGGKTTLMFYLANQLRGNKTLVTTTTKIFLPEKNFYDEIFILEDFEQVLKNIKNGITVMACSIVKNKLTGYCGNDISIISNYFDFTFVESDGSKMKYLKAWNDNEPIVIEETTKTVGIINLQLLENQINDTNIHRSELYIHNFVNDKSPIVTLCQIKNIILSPNGLFRNAVSDKFLFINIVETDEDYDNVKKLISMLTTEERKQFKKIIWGSLKNERFSWE